jgi:transposase
MHDTVLKSLGRDVDELYAVTGRPSIPPERLLKASLLIALYSVRSDRLFCEMLDYNILFRWFLDMNLEERGLDQWNFSRLRERLVDSELGCRFFDAVVGQARKLDLLSDEHFTVDGTLIEAWASTAKSMRRKGGPGRRWAGRSRSGQHPRRTAHQRDPRLGHRCQCQAHAQRQG